MTQIRHLRWTPEADVVDAPRGRDA